MSISPQFKARIALLWGDRWWVEGRSEPVVFGEFSRAAETLLAEFGDERPARLRLIYQPPSFVSVATACPQGGRTALRDALQEEFPALGKDDCAWAYEPIAIGPQTGATLLHYETEPGLLPLTRTLRDAGIEIEGAWPLATALNLVPSDWPDTGALTVIAVADKLTAVFRHTPTGARDVSSAIGNDAAELAAATAHAVGERPDTALYVVALDETGQRFADLLARTNVPEQAAVDWPDLVRAAQTLSPRQPNQLLPAGAGFTVRQLATSLTIAAMLASVALGIELDRNVRAERRAAMLQTEETRALATEVAALRQSEAEANRLRAALASHAPNRAACAQLLRMLGRDLPQQVVLTRIHADEGGFLLAGGVAGAGLTDAGWRAWRDALQTEAAPWRLADAAAARPTADFTLRGAWR